MNFRKKISGALKVEKKNQETMKLWQRNRFGMFIHWGIYALPARHEWVKSREQISDADYQKYFDHFYPDLYDPAEWADYCKKAGMKYVVLTTKHHDGFCLWDTKLTDWKVTNTPWGKDLLRPYVDAFRAAGIRIGLYHSIIDWHHPHYTTDRTHPRRDCEEHKAGDANRDMGIYAEYLRGQVSEILTDYGEIDMIFFDFSISDPDNPGKYQKGRNEWQSEKLVKTCRELQPGILINDRLDLQEFDWGWDFTTPEQFMLRKCPVDGKGNPIPWETCQTFSGAWGYHRDENTWKSTEQLLKMLIDTVSKGGNLLLNVGPTGRGEFDYRAKDRLLGMGEWMDTHARSIYGCTQAPDDIAAPQDCRLTWNPETKRLYVHIFSWPPTGELYIEGLGGKVKYAQLLHDASEVLENPRAKWQQKWELATESTYTMKLPIRKPNCIVPVVELFLD